jgi:hypothetical protein
MTESLTELAESMAEGFQRLRFAANMYDDHQHRRIAVGNQIGSQTIDVRAYAGYGAAMKDLEADLSKRLVSTYREVVPIGIRDWAKGTSGVGEHLLALLLGHLGHPRLAIPKFWVSNDDVADDEFGSLESPKRFLEAGEPFLRSVSQVWQYCGRGRSERRRRGMSQEEAMALGNPACKRLTYLLAQSVVKQQVRKGAAMGPLGQFYLDEKERYRHRVHTGPCPGGPALIADSATGRKRAVVMRCKIDGRYADKGDPFQPSHINAIGLRHLGKRILMQLYDAAYEPWCDQLASET